MKANELEIGKKYYTNSYTGIIVGAGQKSPNRDRLNSPKISQPESANAQFFLSYI